MVKTSEEPILSIPVGGSQLALILAATFMFELWKFEQPEARALLVNHPDRLGLGLEEEIFTQSKRILSAAGAFECPTRLWTRDFIQRRAATRGVLSLTLEQVQLVILALQASYEEFSRYWGEFCTAAPGMLEAYGCSAEDLLELVRLLSDLLGAEDEVV